jgi:hypothetical protein
MTETLTYPSSSAPNDSQYLEQDATVDNVDTVVLIKDQGQDINGFVFKANASAETAYGKGQAFLVLEEGSGDATDQTSAGSVMFRVDRHGNVGFTGGLHVATGMRNDEAQPQAVWIDPSDNMIGLVITSPETSELAVWNKDYVQVIDARNANEVVFRISYLGGAVLSAREITARETAATRTSIGDCYGFAGVLMGSGADTIMYRAAAGIVGVGNLLELGEVAAPSAPAANKGRLFLRDNGSGKTQLCIIFNTGAVQVIATQP